ncbi:hypothetical protein [Haliscomenobacter hydrossis]|uniref:Uncharacterized protein n=1 Tax=Haliscomenobacter hydrossis (strain ATCC 27775 / DSM 1100 / LMG 10767 / O) TaxID=760192 RepID=F4L821_HALH1|nr:hypothetical protein [Haliscomenobacter hydrossis]AEE54529.1 hypothetical protein Halhy_6714 [Haliscomenobacter hydrossis DSM 1100]
MKTCLLVLAFFLPLSCEQERSFFIPVTVYGHWSPADGVTWTTGSQWVDPMLDFEGMESATWCCSTRLDLKAIRMPGYRYYAEIWRPIPTLLKGCVDVNEERYAAAFDFEIDLRVAESLVP